MKIPSVCGLESKRKVCNIKIYLEDLLKRFCHRFGDISFELEPIKEPLTLKCTFYIRTKNSLTLEKVGSCLRDLMCRFSLIDKSLLLTGWKSYVIQ